MNIQDELAAKRTTLANQRTFLSFVTASLAVTVSGVTVIRFFPGHWSYWLDWMLLPAAAFLFTCGIVNFYRQKRKIREICETHPPSPTA